MDNPIAVILCVCARACVCACMHACVMCVHVVCTCVHVVCACACVLSAHLCLCCIHVLVCIQSTYIPNNWMNQRHQGWDNYKAVLVDDCLHHYLGDNFAGGYVPPWTYAGNFDPSVASLS